MVDKISKEQEAFEKEQAREMKVILKFKEALIKFAEFMKIVKPNEDPALRPNMILDPRNPLTASNLTEIQIDFITESYFIADKFKELEPLKDFAKIYLQANASKNGWAIDKVVEFEQALGEKRMFQLGFKNEAQRPEKGKTNETKQ